jgi:hypothetical protein
MLALTPPRGVAVLPSYRLYCLDGAGRITTAEWLDAADDADATRQARERKLGVASEVWDRSRLVARIEVEKPTD